MVCNSLGKHCFSGSRRTIEKHTSGRVNSNLFIKMMMCERQLNGFTDFLLLNVTASNILKTKKNKLRVDWKDVKKKKKAEEIHKPLTHVISYIRLLRLAKQRNTGICFWWQHINQSIRMSVQCHRRRGFEQFPIDGTQYPDIIVGSRG